MKYAIVESGGKQYKAVEGETIEVDRLPVDAGDKVGLERVLMLVDGDDIAVGTPTVDGVQVSTTVTEHFKGPKITVFKYAPKNRIRVKGGHRQQYTRLMVDTIGAGKKASKAKKEEAPAEQEVEAKAEKKTEKKAEKTPAKKASTKKTEKAPAKKTTTKKTTTKKSSSTDKTKK